MLLIELTKQGGPAMKATTSVALAAALGLGVSGASAAEWTPEQPITIIVPW
jgi:tripartite-type tricarboxylate transporter receptor subunit TctC